MAKAKSGARAKGPAKRQSKRKSAVQPAATPQTGEQDRVLLRTLMHAFYWFDDGLQAYMQREAGFSLPRAQSMIMVCLTEGVSSPMELARRLKVSKQAIRQALRSMIESGVVTVDPDPDNGRQRVVRVTARGRAMRDIAQRGLPLLERELARRIGRERVETLHDVLNADWGSAAVDVTGTD
jgi:DNA-binding MarR family transcriptional regulator